MSEKPQKERDAKLVRVTVAREVRVRGRLTEPEFKPTSTRSVNEIRENLGEARTNSRTALTPTNPALHGRPRQPRRLGSARPKSGSHGGIFVERLYPLRYVRSENANRIQTYVAVSGVFEPNMTRTISAPHDKSLREAQRARKVA
jgi:hypothetical protein